MEKLFPEAVTTSSLRLVCPALSGSNESVKVTSPVRRMVGRTSSNPFADPRLVTSARSRVNAGPEILYISGTSTTPGNAYNVAVNAQIPIPSIASIVVYGVSDGTSVVKVLEIN